MATRTVKISVSAKCGTPYIHQPFYIQLSIGNQWVPAKPMRFPPNRLKPDGSPDDSPVIDVYDVAAALYNAVKATGASMRSFNRTADFGKKTKAGEYRVNEVDSFTFNTDAGEVDYSCVGVEPTTTGETPQGECPFNLVVEVEKGPGEFVVKHVPEQTLYKYRSGWVHKKKGPITPHDTEFTAYVVREAGGLVGTKGMILGLHDPDCPGDHVLGIRAILPRDGESWLTEYAGAWLVQPTIAERMRGTMSGPGMRAPALLSQQRRVEVTNENNIQRKPASDSRFNSGV